MKHLLALLLGTTLLSAQTLPDDSLILNYHLMHPGGDSGPGDPNPIFCLEGVYHLHYIIRHDWQGKNSFSFVHVTSKDMLHWKWERTKLQPSFTGHGMFSGTGFITKEGKAAAIYHGQASGQNWIAIAKDHTLSKWEKPFPMELKAAQGELPKLRVWDPDCWRVGDTYYALFGGENPPVMKSTDLRHWTYLGPLLQKDLPDTAKGEDVSCGNLFPIGDKWMLLCISHSLGCRYYLGDWDAKAEQFVPQSHGRMNWPRDFQHRNKQARDFFAPESVLTPDGRRVMWAWLATLHPAIDRKTMQSLPRELTLAKDHTLRIAPLRELETLREAPLIQENVEMASDDKDALVSLVPRRIAELPGAAVELRVTIDRAEADRKIFGFNLFSDGKGGGTPLILRPDKRIIRLGDTEAPFAVADLPAGEPLELRIFVDNYLVEVFVNNRQALVAANVEGKANRGLDAFSFSHPTTLKKLEIWKLKPANEGFLEARKNRVWEPKTK